MNSEERQEAIKHAMENNVRAARQFYEADHSLSVDDRQKLAGIFWKQMTLVPFGALPFVILGIQFPRYASQRNFIFRKGQSYRGWQVVFGLAGLIVGSRASGEFGYWYGRNSFDQDSNAQKVFVMLGKYPPQLGLTYYQRTAKDPSWIMHDPSTIDWKKEPGWPLNLAIHRREMAQGPRGAPMGGMHYPQTPSSSTPSSDTFSADSVPREDDSFTNTVAAPASSDGSGMSSWDRIRAQSRSSASSGAEASPQLPPMSAYRLPPREQRQQASGGPVRGEVVPVAPAETQEEFDKELERERQGGGVPDDFSESEKKWS